MLNYNAPNRLSRIITLNGGVFDINLTNGVPLPALVGKRPCLRHRILGGVDGNGSITNCISLSGPRNRSRACASGGVPAASS